jgi:hypothetical protein
MKHIIHDLMSRKIYICKKQHIVILDHHKLITYIDTNYFGSYYDVNILQQ